MIFTGASDCMSNVKNYGGMGDLPDITQDTNLRESREGKGMAVGGLACPCEAADQGTPCRSLGRKPGRSTEGAGHPHAGHSV